MSAIKYNFYKTHDFLPERSSDEIEPTINANILGPLAQNHKIINISIRIKNDKSSHCSKNVHHKKEIKQFTINKKSTSMLINQHEKYCNLKDCRSIADPNLLTTLVQKSKNSISNSPYIFNNNAICVLFIEDSQGRKEYARTEVIWNQDEPNWVKCISLEVFPDISEMLYFEIYEITSNNRNIEHQKLLAVGNIELNTLVHSLSKYVQVPLSKAGTNDTVGYLDLNYYEPMPDVEGSYIFTFKVNEFHSPTRIIQSPQPYFIIKRMNESSNHYMNVYKSRVVNHLKNKTAEWKCIELNLQAICGGDIDLPIRISLYDFLSQKHVNNKNGFIDTTLRRLIENKDFDFADDEGKIIAHLYAEFITKNENPCFFDFKLKGMKIQPILGIDFSSTKINYVDSNRLLHFDNSQFSYIAAITEIYDSIHELVKDQSFISYAFANFKGAKVLPLYCENMKENQKISMNIDQTKNICCSYTPRKSAMIQSQQRNCEHKSYHSSIKTIVDCYNYTKNHITYPEYSLVEPLISKALKDAQHRFEVDGTISLLIIVSNGIFADFNIAVNRLVEAEDIPLITLFVLMDGMRTEINNRIIQTKGKLVDDLGLKSKRILADAVIYSDGSTLCDNRLDEKIVPSIERMVTDFFKTHLNLL